MENPPAETALREQFSEQLNLLHRRIEQKNQALAGEVQQLALLTRLLQAQMQTQDETNTREPDIKVEEFRAYP